MSNFIKVISSGSGIFLDSKNSVNDMESHAKYRVTLNLKANGEQCSIFYIIIVILDLKYVEIDTGISPHSTNTDRDIRGHAK